MSDSALEQKAVEIITNLEKLAEPAMQMTLKAIRTAAIIDTVLCVGFLVLAVVVWRTVGVRLYQQYKNTRGEFIEAAGGIGFCVAGLVTTVLSVICIVSLFSASTWLSIFAPELQLARILISKVTG